MESAIAREEKSFKQITLVAVAQPLAVNVATKTTGIKMPASAGHAPGTKFKSRAHLLPANVQIAQKRKQNATPRDKYTTATGVAVAHAQIAANTFNQTSKKIPANAQPMHQQWRSATPKVRLTILIAALAAPTFALLELSLQMPPAPAAAFSVQELP